MNLNLKKYYETKLACGKHNEQLDHSWEFFVFYVETGEDNKRNTTKGMHKNKSDAWNKPYPQKQRALTVIPVRLPWPRGVASPTM